jgi:hypothetical protein
MTLREKWIDILHKAVTGSRNMRTILTPVGLLIFLGAIVLLVVLALWVDRLLGFPKLFGSPWNIGVSVPVLAIGLFFVL